MRKKRCGRGRNCFHELTLSLSEWRALLKYSYELDLNKGSYYDGRSGCINFWCGPENKPRDWPGQITKGYLKYPRDFVGTVYGEYDDHSRKYRLHFDVTAYSRADRFKSRTPKWNKAADGTREDRAWVLEQFRLLRQHVSLMRQKPKASN